MVSIETPVEIKLSLGNPIYRGPEGKTPVKGVDYFTQEDINDIVAQIEGGDGIDLSSYATKVYVDEAVESIEIPETDLTDYATKIYVDSAIEGVVVEETDPTVPSWAKQPNKPTYTAQEVGALPTNTALFSGDYNDLSNKPTIPVVPTNVSSFTNDAGYLTTHQSLTDYATKSYVETAIRGAESGLLKRSVVQALPVSDIDEDTIYMVAKTGSTGDVYDEYLYVNSNWEHIGSTDVDLTGYATETYVDNAISTISGKEVLFIDSNKDAHNEEVIQKLHAINNAISKQKYNEIPYAVVIDGRLVIRYDLGYSSSNYPDAIPKLVVFNNGGFVSLSGDSFYGSGYSISLLSDNISFYAKTSLTGERASLTDNISYIKNNYATQSYVDTSMPAYLTNSDILAIWNGENE